MKQETLVDEEDVRPGLAGKTVWVVAGIFVDDPHPDVLGVYDNPEAAEELEDAIRAKNGHWDGWDLASFWTYDVEIESDFGGTNED